MTTIDARLPEDPVTSLEKEMATIHHQLAIVAPIETVYAAIASAEGIGAWWDNGTAVEGHPGLMLEHRAGEGQEMLKLKVLELTPNRRVVWECISRHPASSPASIWTGTQILFELSEQGGAASAVERESDPPGNFGRHVTTLDFQQTQCDPDSKYAGFNNFTWGQILNTLKRVCESPRCHMALSLVYNQYRLQK